MNDEVVGVQDVDEGPEEIFIGGLRRERKRDIRDAKRILNDFEQTNE